MSKDEVTLFVEPSQEALQLREEIAKTGVAVHIVYSSGIPYIESPLATIRGYGNIRNYFALADAS